MRVLILMSLITIGVVGALPGGGHVGEPSGSSGPELGPEICLNVAGHPTCPDGSECCPQPYCVFGEILPNVADPSKFWGQCYFRVDSDWEQFAWAYFYVAPFPPPSVTFTYYVDGVQVPPTNIRYEPYKNATGNLNGFNGFFAKPYPHRNLTSVMNIYAVDSSCTPPKQTLAGVLPINKRCPCPS